MDDVSLSANLERWSSKVVTPARAIAQIPRGRRILIGSGAAEPSSLVDALVRDGEHLADNAIVHLLTLGPAPYVAPELQGRFRHTAFFIGANVREAVQDGRADFMPVFLSEIPALIRSRRVRIDVVLIQVSPPDRHGYVSLGVSVDIVRAATEAADLVIAEVNRRMPRTLGDSFVHVRDIDYLVPTDSELPELQAEPLDEVTRAIGRHVATLIPDGATLQTGIGKIPHAVVRELTSRSDLGIHTEMLSDPVLELCEAGVVTGKKKTLLPGKIVTSFIMGSRRLYDWAHENPAIEMRPSDFTNDPFVVSQNDRMVAINSALAIDLTGQVAADTLLGGFFSGIGGQVDFVRGAARSKDGRAIIALPSTAKDGKVSRIRPVLEEGAGIVTSRGDVRYVATEYGIADLWGKNIRQRAMALIAIAHPDIRSELVDAAKARHYVFVDQVVSRMVYPWEEDRRERLPSGTEISVRPMKITDYEALQDLFYRLSDESIHQRYFHYKKTHPRSEIQKLVDLDYEQNMALVATYAGDSGEELIGLCRYDVDPSTHYAEIAFVVRDEWQGKGVGTELMRRMAEIGKKRGLAGFTAHVLQHNSLMLNVCNESGLSVQSELVDGVYLVKLTFAPKTTLAPPSAAPTTASRSSPPGRPT